MCTCAMCLDLYCLSAGWEGLVCMPALSNKASCLLLLGTRSDDDPVVSGPRHRAAERHMTTPGHIQSISKGSRNYMLQRSLFAPFLFGFLNDSFLRRFWVAPDRAQRTYITALWRHGWCGCHGNVRPCLSLSCSHCLFPGTVKRTFTSALYVVWSGRRFSYCNLVWESGARAAGCVFPSRPQEGWPSFIALECLWSVFLSWTGKIQSSVWLLGCGWAYSCLFGEMSEC